MDNKHSMPQQWFCREGLPDKAGVLVIPALKEIPTDAQGVKHWIFVADKSGSMNEHVLGTRFTRWQVAVNLMEEAIKQLSVLRPRDYLSVYCFDSQVQAIMEKVPMNEVKFIPDNIYPGGNTNIGAANAMVGCKMKTDADILSGRHEVVELFFTDGQATEGVTNAQTLMKQKQNDYQYVTSHSGKEPMLWCGAISDVADRHLIKSMSRACSRALWAHIGSREMVNFASEIGGAIATVLQTEPVKFMVPMICDLPVSDKPTVPDQKKRVMFEQVTHWRLFDADTYLYMAHRPLGLTDTWELECTPLVDVYEIQNRLVVNQNIPQSELKEIKAKLEELQAQTHLLLLGSEELLMQFEKIRMECMGVAEELLQCYQFGERPELRRQFSLLRNMSGDSKTVLNTRENFKRVYANLEAIPPLVRECNNNCC